MYPGSDNGATETYMMPGTGPNPQVSIIPHPAEFGYMANEVAPEVIYDQGLYYPAANYYGYYCTGLEPQSEWNDHHRFFGVDGQEILYSGLQAESYPYVYCSPSYGYAQSSYNPYNPYIPGAVIGPESPDVGSQQYFSNPSYQLPVSPPTAYFPMVVQPSSDTVQNSSMGPSFSSGTGTSAPSRQAGVGSKHSQAHLSSNRGNTFQGSASRISDFESSLPAPSEVSANVSSSKQPSPLINSGSINQMAQGRTSSGLMQARDHSSHGNVSSIQIPTNVAPSNLLSNYGTGIHGWATADRFRPRFQVNGAGKNGSGSHDILGEQNRGPRTSKSKGQWTSSISAQATRVGAENDQEAIVIRADQYNRDDFPVDYPYAKFFVIKSYSEDDVHKSIKYNVWSSTPNGNKRLDAAYEDAHKMSAGKSRACPIFLFFSVNASGQFCGVAEMIGPVDFHKDMDFWQQDKWTGNFPVKWHIIKDVPNTSFRHIVLENNENKPVTNSRDTQEIAYVPGMNMLSLFKSSPLKTSILDDFMFYEERQKIIQDEKSRFTGRSNTYIPAVVYASKPIESADENDSADNSSKDIGVKSSVNADHSLNADQVAVVETVQPNLEHKESSGSGILIDTPKSNSTELSNDKKDVESLSTGDADVSTSVFNLESLSIGSKGGSTEKIVARSSAEADVVTVGSVNIKVNGSVVI